MKKYQCVFCRYYNSKAKLPYYILKEYDKHLNNHFWHKVIMLIIGE